VPFDPILGVGYEPRPQPAVVGDSIDFAFGPSAGAIDNTETLTIPNDMRVQFMHITLNFDDPGGHTNPLIVLRINGKEIDRFQWLITLAEINTLAGSGLLYSFIANRSDFLRVGDTITLQLTTGTAAAPEDYTFTYNLNIVGVWA